MKTIHDENKIDEILNDAYYITEIDQLGIMKIAESMQEYAEYMIEKTIDECIACVPKLDTDPANYQSEQVMGLNFAIEQTITNLNKLKNNE